MQNVTIVFGSEYGNAMSIAEKITVILKQNANLHCDLINAKDYAKINFSQKQILVMVTSTYHGKPPGNAGKFMKFIKNSDPEFFANLKVAVLGIGSTDYTEFCKAAKDFESNLVDHGATRLVMGPLGIQGIYSGPTGAADDAIGLQEVEPWIDNLNETLKKVAQEAAHKAAQKAAQEAAQEAAHKAAQKATQENRWLGIIIFTSIAMLMVNRIRPV